MEVTMAGGGGGYSNHQSSNRMNATSNQGTASRNSSRNGGNYGSGWKQ